MSDGDDKSLVAPEASSLDREQMIEDGKPFAIAAHVGHVVCLPLFIIPFLMDKNEFALIHAKYAAVNFVLSIAASIIIGTLVSLSCGLLAPLYMAVFIFWVPMIQGILSAVNGKVDEPLVIGQIGRAMFGEDFNKLPE